MPRLGNRRRESRRGVGALVRQQRLVAYSALRDHPVVADDHQVLEVRVRGHQQIEQLLDMVCHVVGGQRVIRSGVPPRIDLSQLRVVVEVDEGTRDARVRRQGA